MFAGIGLGNVEVVYVYTAFGSVVGVEGVFHIHKGTKAAPFLGFGDDVLAEGGLTGRFWPVDFYDSAAWHTTDAEGNCTAVDGCGLDPEDDCLAEHEPRAWSSPIFVDFAPL